MELKSLIEKIMIINDALRYSDSTERLINKEYLLNDDSQTHKKLEKLLIDSINYSQSQELKLGLELILVLISHKNENVKSSALAKMFVLMDDGLIQELVVKELKVMSNNKDKNINEPAEDSLDLIATEIHKFELMEAFFDICTGLKDKFVFKVSKFKFPFIYSLYFDKLNSADVPRRKIENNIFYGKDLFNGLVCKARALNRRIDRMFPYLEEIGDYNEDFMKYKKSAYLNIENSESGEKESLQKLADFYARTFTERGHLRRLIALLDDNSDDIQQIGINALIDVVEILLKDSAEKRVIKPLNSNDLEKISPFRS